MLASYGAGVKAFLFACFLFVSVFEDTKEGKEGQEQGQEGAAGRRKDGKRGRAGAVIQRSRAGHTGRQGKSPKVWQGQAETDPHPSKKKSFSVPGSLRQTAI